MTPLRVGLVCPYSFDAPGGVQAHVVDLARRLRALGHHAEVLAPAEPGTDLPDVVTAAGGSVAVPYNGSVARLAFTPRSAAQVRRWLEAGDFDVLHLHEPVVPSLALQTLWLADGPIVATFHFSMERSRALQVAAPIVLPLLDKVGGRIAVSAEARRTLVQHLGGDAVVVPNGVDVAAFRAAGPDARWTGTPDAPTIAFLGRLDEPRKGLPILVDAYLRVLDTHPGARLLVAGRGDAAEAHAALTADSRTAGRVEFLGGISETDKRALLSSVDAYVAPQTGGESFGIVLVEAMAAGSLVVASDLPAFKAVLDDGALGRVFAHGDPADLARVLTEALGDRDGAARTRAAAGAAVGRYDWTAVTERILAVYETVIATAATRVRPDPRTLAARVRGVGAGTAPGTTAGEGA